MNAHAAAGPSVCEIKSITVIVTLKTAEGKNRFIAEGSKLFVGDTITTEKESTAVLTFVDTSQVALRPSTRFVVADFQFKPEAPSQDSAQFKLVKGGLRTLTGLVGKRGNQDAYRLQSETATIGIRGTDFTARLCKGGDCQDSNQAAEKAVNTNVTTADVSGRVSSIDGEAKVTSDKGKTRILIKGSAVFAGDTIDVGNNGTVVLAMADATRLTLPAGTKFSVQQYRYIPSSPEASFASYKLLKGVVRTVSGSIAKAKPENVAYSTPTATVGIRGTAFDLACTTSSEAVTTLVACSDGANVVVVMRDGTVLVTNDKGSLQLTSGQTAVITSAQVPPALTTTPIDLFKGLQSQPPLPENTPANFEQLSTVPNTSASNAAAAADLNALPQEDSLFLAVNDGTVVIANGDQQILVNRGEGAIVQTQTINPPRLLVAPPAIIQRDTILTAPAFAAPSCGP